MSIRSIYKSQKATSSRFSFPERSGPGPRKARDSSPSYTVIAAHHVGLGERVLASDFDPRELVMKEGECIENVEYVGSYKWIESEDERPTIAVPGAHPYLYMLILTDLSKVRN
jgi:hypothetical protein